MEKNVLITNVLITYTFDKHWHKSKKPTTPGSALDRVAVVLEAVQF